MEKTIDDFDTKTFSQPKKETTPIISLTNTPVKASIEILDTNHQIWQEPSQSTNCQTLELAIGKKGDPVSNADNVLRILERIPAFKNLVWFDVFHNRYFVRYKAQAVREWSDIDDDTLTTFLQRKIPLPHIRKDHVSTAIRIFAYRNARNEPKDWLETLEWDGIERTPHFFSDCLGADDTEYTRSASNNFWICMAARIYKPGCQVDTMVVLEGPQGIRKTTALTAIGGKWHTECKEQVSSKDFFQALDGKLIIEIAELDSFSRAEITRIKQVISCRTDRYRAPYGRRAEDHPRMCVFVGTTNEENYLRDNTGGRRFWPIKCESINIDLIESNREQLFAEAVARYKRGETWYEMPVEDTLAAQEARRQEDAWEAAVLHWSENREAITILQVATECLHVEVAKLDKGTQMRIAAVLRSLGWSKKDGWLEGRKQKYWEKHEAPQG